MADSGDDVYTPLPTDAAAPSGPQYDSLSGSLIVDQSLKFRLAHHGQSLLQTASGFRYAAFVQHPINVLPASRVVAAHDAAVEGLGSAAFGPGDDTSTVSETGVTTMDESDGLDFGNTDDTSSFDGSDLTGGGGETYDTWQDDAGNTYDQDGNLISSGPGTSEEQQPQYDNQNNNSAGGGSSGRSSGGGGGGAQSLSRQRDTRGMTPNPYGNATPNPASTTPNNRYGFPIGGGLQVPTTNDILGNPVYRVAPRGVGSVSTRPTSPGGGGPANSGTIAQLTSNPMLLLAMAALGAIFLMRKG